MAIREVKDAEREAIFFNLQTLFLDHVAGLEERNTEVGIKQSALERLRTATPDTLMSLLIDPPKPLLRDISQYLPVKKLQAAMDGINNLFPSGSKEDPEVIHKARSACFFLSGKIEGIKDTTQLQKLYGETGLI